MSFSILTISIRRHYINTRRVRLNASHVNSIFNVSDRLLNLFATFTCKNENEKKKKTTFIYCLLQTIFYAFVIEAHNTLTKFF